MNFEKKRSSHLTAALQALFVTFLWSTSWVLIKIGLNANLPSLTFAGLRYTLAFLCLLPLVLFNQSHIQTIKRLSGKDWLSLVGLGFLFYTVTQGAQFVSLSFLRAATLTLLLNLSPILVAISSIFNQHEKTSITQWFGILISIMGVFIYFFPLLIESGQSFGLIAGIVGLFANALSSIYGRYINARKNFNPLVVTCISMGFGGIMLLLSGTVIQGFGTINTNQWLIIALLALVNTALAFTLWNKTLQTLTAVESSIINGTMLPQIAIMAWIFLNETLGTKEIIGISFVLIGTLIVQLWRYVSTNKNKTPSN